MLLMRLGFTYNETQHLTGREITEYLEDGVTSYGWLINSIIQKLFKNDEKPIGEPPKVGPKERKVKKVGIEPTTVMVDEAGAADLASLFGKINRL
jgi:hypothetical protein